MNRVGHEALERVVEALRRGAGASGSPELGSFVSREDRRPRRNFGFTGGRTVHGKRSATRCVAPLLGRDCSPVRRRCARGSLGANTDRVAPMPPRVGRASRIGFSDESNAQDSCRSRRPFRSTWNVPAVVDHGLSLSRHRQAYAWVSCSIPPTLGSSALSKESTAGDRRRWLKRSGTLREQPSRGLTANLA